MSPDRHALPGAAPAAGRLRAVDAPRRAGDLPQGRRADPHVGRRLPGRARAGGRRRLGRAHLLAAARRRARGQRAVLRGARRPRRARACATSSSFFGEVPPNWSLRVGRPPHPRRRRRARRPGGAGHAGAVGAARHRSRSRSCPAACSSATWRPPRSSPGWSRTCASSGAGPSPRPGSRLMRPWHVVGLAVRPEHRMRATPLSSCTARRLADGVVPPRPQRRPHESVTSVVTQAATRLSWNGRTLHRQGAVRMRDARTTSNATEWWITGSPHG